MCFEDATMESHKIEAILYEPLPVLPWKIRDHDYQLPFCKLVSNMKKLRWLSVSTMGQDKDEGPNFLSNELRYIEWYSYPAISPFLNGFLPVKLVVLKLTDCKQKELWKGYQLCQVSLIDGLSDRLLQFMLKGKAIENGSMRLQLEGLEIPKGLTPPLLRGNRCRLELPENWCNDYSGFLICVVTSYDYFAIPYRIWISMKQVSNNVSEDDVIWEERRGDEYMTWVWGFGVRLVEKKSGSGLTETSRYSSHHTPMIKIQHDSASTLTIS
ncbi:hypothetical protein M8C21_007875 [Ambrosia artemisiifolia]|uniref:Uncharacterized protein n=1 Tax=Ambrosia artemisiifolia TaxID=4212 RepID=A0AAD5BRC5_AMBAR|nr:hypothetical protein M8C21_007875 [Ambrosia artemisiifolia]